MWRFSHLPQRIRSYRSFGRPRRRRGRRPPAIGSSRNEASSAAVGLASCSLDSVSTILSWWAGATCFEKGGGSCVASGYFQGGKSDGNRYGSRVSSISSRDCEKGRLQVGAS